jgi:F0F1-type ATP synthase membrane subunit c/vacuolar-type H+-ATPase subunit K
MPQHINLMHAGLGRRTEPFHSVHGAIAIAAAVGLAALGACVLQGQAQARAEQAAALERDTLALQSRMLALAAAPSAPAGTHELQRLRHAEAGQRQVRAAIASGTAGRAQGYAGYFSALGRQSQAALWITGFAVAADGVALELQGRMTDPRVLPDYLRRLNAEPLFKGREFSQLSLKAVETPDTGSVAYTEFALRGLPAASEPAR